MGYDNSETGSCPAYKIKKSQTINHDTVLQSSLYFSPASKVNRTHKSENQKNELWNIFKQTRGVLPKTDEISQYARKLNLSENQIYKWFWDTKKRVEDSEYFEEEGMNGKGQLLTRHQIRNALKINQDQKDVEIDSLAEQLNLPIENIA